MNDLIGKKFRRNKYGPSIWEDRIIRVYLAYPLVRPINQQLVPFWSKEYAKEYEENRKYGFKVVPMIEGETSGKFNLDEIIIYP